MKNSISEIEQAFIRKATAVIFLGPSLLVAWLVAVIWPGDRYLFEVLKRYFQDSWEGEA